METRSEARPGGAGTDERAGVRLDAAEIEGLERRTLTSGVQGATLWSYNSSHAGVLWLEPGAQLGAHTHRRHAHHVWVVEGHVTCIDHELGRGSYSYVPPGTEHDSVAGEDGAVLFYLYLDTRDEPPAAHA